MTTSTAERLTVGPPPDPYDGGPINVLYQQTGDDRPAELKTCGTLAEAQAFAQTCVDNGFLAGTLTFQAADHGPTQLQQLVDQEQADHDTARPTPDELEALGVSREVQEAVARGEADDDPADYTIERVAADGTVKTADTGLTLADATARLDKRRCRAGSTIRIVRDGETVATKQPGGKIDGPATEPSHFIVFVQADGRETVERQGDETTILSRFKTTPLPAEGHLELREADGTVLAIKPPATIDELADGLTNAVATIIDDQLEEQGETPMFRETSHTGTTDDVPSQPTGGALFDPGDFDDPALRLPPIDGRKVDEIQLAFSGTVKLDRHDPADVALFRSLTLGQDVTLQVEGMCAGLTGKGATNRDGDLDVVVGVRRIKVHTIYLPVTADEAA